MFPLPTPSSTVRHRFQSIHGIGLEGRSDGEMEGPLGLSLFW
jgi:hypothetical protein